MAVQIEIADDKISNFSDDARESFKKQVEKYADDLVREANLLEETARENGAAMEITSNIVLQAARKNKIIHTKKANRFLLVMKIVSSLSLTATGFLFDSNGFQDNKIGFFAFMAVFTVAAVSTVLQFVKEDEG